MDPVISIIAALDEGDVIGRANALPWRLPADLKWFKERTLGKPVIMGRETCESIPGPLPGRKNIVMSRTWSEAPAGFMLARSPDEALALAIPAPEVMIAGGAQVFAAFLPRASRMYLTRVHHRFDGDTRFPPVDLSEWRETFRSERGSDDRNPHALTFSILERGRGGA